MPESPLDGVRLNIVRSLDDALEVKRWIGERRETPVGFDVETGGLDPYRHRLRLIQLGDLRTGWVIPYPQWGGLAKELFSSYTGRLAGHNASFDHRYLSIHAGISIPWHLVEDTMVLAAIDDPSRPKGLKPLANALVRENAWSWDTVPESYTPWWCYAALDPVLTCHLWQHLHPRVMARCPGVYDLEMGVIRVISNMMKAGLQTDRAWIEEKTRELRDRSLEIRTWLSLGYGITTPNSGPQVARAFASLGYEVGSFTATGQPRIDKEVLEYIGKTTDDPAVKDLARSVYAVRHAERMISSYLENFTELADQDGVIHPQIWSLTARTSRMSVTEPALQTLSRDDKIVRGAFVPRPGHVLISIDADQIEARLGAILSQDEGLILAFKNADSGGLDFYSGMASEIFGEQIQKSDPRRQATKSTFYSRMYGAGIETMARTAGIPLAQAKLLNDRINERYPGLDRMARRIASECYEQKQCGEQPVVCTPFGRQLPVDKPHAGTNYVIQAHAAEILKKSMLDIEAAGYASLLRLPVHDELIFEVEGSTAAQTLADLTEVLVNREAYPVTISWGGKIMTARWSK